MEIKFTVAEQNEEPMLSVIEKHGLSTKFTGQDIIEHITHTRKTLKQSHAQLEAEDMQDKLAISILPQLADLPEDKYNVAIAFMERKIARGPLVDLVEACEKTIKSYEEQVEEIKEQTGIDIQLPIESPYRKVDEEANKKTGDAESGEAISTEE